MADERSFVLAPNMSLKTRRNVLDLINHLEGQDNRDVAMRNIILQYIKTNYYPVENSTPNNILTAFMNSCTTKSTYIDAFSTLFNHDINLFYDMIRTFVTRE